MLFCNKKKKTDKKGFPLKSAESGVPWAGRQEGEKGGEALLGYVGRLPGGGELLED